MKYKVNDDRIEINSCCTSRDLGGGLASSGGFEMQGLITCHRTSMRCGEARNERRMRLSSNAEALCLGLNVWTSGLTISQICSLCMLG